jgi:hypothetical protein
MVLVEEVDHVEHLLCDREPDAIRAVEDGNVGIDAEL